MTPEPDDTPDWSEFRAYPTASEAEVDAAYLRSQGIPARVTVHTPMPGMNGKALVWVPRDSKDRADWFLKLPPVSEAELEYLATGEFPHPDGAERPEDLP